MPDPTGKISNFMTGLQTQLAANAGITGWGAAVVLGRKPATNQDYEASGPVAYIRRGGLFVNNAGAEKTFIHELQLIVTLVWFEDRTASNTGVTETNFLDQIIDGLEDIGNALVSGFGGQFVNISTPDLYEVDEQDRNIYYTEITLTIWY